jgi:RNA polymerase sigma factor (sigma-70 family)
MVPMNKVIEALRRAALVGPGAGPSDAELLDRFLSDRDEIAFEGLVRRHGPMVLGVCRRILGHVQDAEDAFQATFLVLVRKATTILPRERVGNWLYGVAQQTARKARSLAARRQGREQTVPVLPDVASAAARALSDEEVLLERELAALPEKYRVAILLCDLEGFSRAEAAAQLGWPENTLSSRLARGRRRLAERLGRAFPAGPLVPAGLVQATTQAASVVASGTAATGAISAPVLALMEGVLQSMVPLKLKFLAAVVLSVGLFGFALGAGQGLLQGPKSAQAPEPAPVQPAPVQPAPAGGDQKVLRELVIPQLSPDTIVELFLEDPKVPIQNKIQPGNLGLKLDVQPKGVVEFSGGLQFEVTQPTNPVPPELIRLLVKENDPERRKQIGQLIEAYQRRPVVMNLVLGDVVLTPENKPNPKEAALKKAEEAIRKLREAAKEKTPDAEAYDALIQAVQKMKAELKK